MFRRKTYKTRVKVPPLPSELWLIIFDIVIEEGIVRLDQCDYTTFPHISSSFTTSARSHQFYDSYYRLRLVCRRFNTMLGARPWQSFSDSSSLPFPTTTRSLYLDLKKVLSSHFQRLFAETSTFGRLVSLDVNCGRSPFYFFEASAGRAFPNVKRLILKIENMPHWPRDGQFWSLLYSSFPLLVTFVLLAEYWTIPEELEWKEGDEIVCFEWLEILYFHDRVPYLGCHFPHLRHASIWACSSRELQILLRSPHLESLLIRSAFVAGLSIIDVTSCLRLKLLGLNYRLFTRVVLLGLYHPVEHIWLYYPFTDPDPDLFQKLWRTAPKAYRIIVEFTSYNWEFDWREFHEQLGRDSDSFGMSMIPSAYGDGCLVFERQPATAEITGGFLRKVWSKMRR
jgi:hypothetical protein